MQTSHKSGTLDGQGEGLELLSQCWCCDLSLNPWFPKLSVPRGLPKGVVPNADFQGWVTAVLMWKVLGESYFIHWLPWVLRKTENHSLILGSGEAASSMMAHLYCFALFSVHILRNTVLKGQFLNWCCLSIALGLCGSFKPATSEICWVVWGVASWVGISPLVYSNATIKSEKCSSKMR